MRNETQDLIKASDAAKRLGIHPNTLKHWSDSGVIDQPLRIGPGNRRFYRTADIDALLQGSVA